MNDPNGFSWRRVGRLTLNTLHAERYNALWYALLYAVVLAVVPIVCEIFQINVGYLDTNVYMGGYFFALSVTITSIALLVKAANAFPELRNSSELADWLALPASLNEKIVSRYLLYTLGMALFATLCCVVFATVGWNFVPAKEIAGNSTGALRGLTFKMVLDFLAQVFIGSLPFFLAGTLFGKSPFIKCLLVVLFSQLAINGLLSLIYLGSFWGWITTSAQTTRMTFIPFTPSPMWMVFCGFCGVAAYFRLKEAQVK